MSSATAHTRTHTHTHTRTHTHSHQSYDRSVCSHFITFMSCMQMQISMYITRAQSCRHMICIFAHRPSLYDCEFAHTHTHTHTHTLKVFREGKTPLCYPCKNAVVFFVQSTVSPAQTSLLRLICTPASRGPIEDTAISPTPRLVPPPYKPVLNRSWRRPLLQNRIFI